MRRLILVLALVGTLAVGTLAAAAPGASAQTVFDGQFYKPIDLARAARDQHGPSAQIVSQCDHLYCWKAKVGKEYRSIDVKAAVTRQYGSSFRLVMVGVHKYDWKAVDFGTIPHAVLPAMIVPSDRFFDVQGVRTGLAQFSSVNASINEWYKLRSNERYRVLQPVVIRSTRTSSQWNQISASTANESTRYALLDAGVAAFKAELPSPSSRLRAIVSPFTGASQDVWLGAAASGRFAVVPPRATSLTCPSSGPLDYRCSDATYAVGHELGHTFGLPHSCDVYAAPACESSIMQARKPWDAVLMSQEAQKLRDLAFFS